MIRFLWGPGNLDPIPRAPFVATARFHAYIYILCVMEPAQPLQLDWTWTGAGCGLVSLQTAPTLSQAQEEFSCENFAKLATQLKYSGLRVDGADLRGGFYRPHPKDKSGSVPSTLKPLYTIRTEIWLVTKPNLCGILWDIPYVSHNFVIRARNRHMGRPQ